MSGAAGLDSISRAGMVLSALAEKGAPCRFADLARATDLPPASLRRLLVGLAEIGLVEQDPETKLYRLGLRLVELGHVAVETLSVRDTALPIMQQLVSETGESCYLARLATAPSMVVYVEAVYCEKLLSVTHYVGRTSASHCTATGKVLLAHASDSVRQRIFEEPLERKTELTIADPADFLSELSRVRSQGYALTQQEFSDEITSIAAPVFDRFGRPDTAVAVCGPSFRLFGAHLEAATRAVIGGAWAISRRLGYTRTPGIQLMPTTSRSL